MMEEPIQCPNCEHVHKVQNELMIMLATEIPELVTCTCKLCKFKFKISRESVKLDEAKDSNV